MKLEQQVDKLVEDVTEVKEAVIRLEGSVNTLVETQKIHNEYDASRLKKVEDEISLWKKFLGAVALAALAGGGAVNAETIKALISSILGL